MSGYTRQSTADIVPTAVVRAAPINAEYNKLRDAFAQSDTGTTGHKHDGTSDEGSYVPLIADLDAKNKIIVSQADNRFGVFVEVSNASTEQLRFQDGVVVPVVDNDIDLGTSLLEYKNLYLDGTAFIDTVSVGDNDNTVITDNAYTVTGNMTFDSSGDINLDADGGNVALKDAGVTYSTLTNNSGNLLLKSNTTTAVTFTDANADFAGTLDVTGAATLDSTLLVKGNTTLGDAISDTVTYTARAVTDFLPNADATYNLGNSSLEWNNLWLDGTANVDTLQVDESATVTVDLSVGQDVDITRDTAIGRNLSVTGATGVDGDFDVNTNKFTVAATTGNTAIAGTLGVTGQISGNVTGDLTGNVTASSGTTTLNNLTVNGTVDFTNTTLVNVSDPTQAQHAATKNYVDTEVSNLVDAAPGALDTLNELAAALGDDPNFSTTVTNSIATKLPLAGGTMTGAIAMGTNKITGLGTPTASTDAATKGYIDSTFGETAAAAASATAAAASAASAASSYDQFDDRYLGAKSSSPTLDNDGDALITGALFFDTTANKMKVYDGSSWLDAGSSVNGTSERQVYTATSGQTTFSITYDVGYVDVYLNGVKLKITTDFTASNGTSIVLASGATAGDIVDIVAYGSFQIADVYTQATSDARFLRISNNLSDLNNASTARTNLGVAIGSDVQAYDAELTELATMGSTTASALADLTQAEVQILDGATVSTAELNYLDGVTSAIQTQLDAKMAPTYTGDVDITGELIVDSYNETYGAVTSSSNATTVNCEAGNAFSHTLTENTTLTFSNPPASGTAFSFSLEIIQDGSASGFTVTWPAATDWPSATAPTLTATASAKDVFVFYTRDGGTNWYGFTAGQALG
jgi:hypothetical protein